jgi:hypothetical protein
MRMVFVLALCVSLVVCDKPFHSISLSLDLEEDASHPAPPQLEKSVLSPKLSKNVPDTISIPKPSFHSTQPRGNLRNHEEDEEDMVGLHVPVLMAHGFVANGVSEVHRNALHVTGSDQVPNAPPKVRDIITSPSFGPTSGGVWVQVIGAGSFHTPNSLQCKLDLVEQYCYSNHYYYSWCYVTPKCSGVFPFHCHNGPLHFETKFAVVAKVPWVTSVYPFSGDVSGGTPVTVRGWNFEPHCPHQLMCRFGTQVVRGKYYTSSSVMCVAPCGVDKGFVSVEVSNDGGNHWSMSGVQFGYVGEKLGASQMDQCRRYLIADAEQVGDELIPTVLAHTLHSSTTLRGPLEQ